MFYLAYLENFCLFRASNLNSTVLLKDIHLKLSIFFVSRFIKILFWKCRKYNKSYKNLNKKDDFNLSYQVFHIVYSVCTKSHNAIPINEYYR